jgi:hypothetical protein
MLMRMWILPREVVRQHVRWKVVDIVVEEVERNHVARPFMAASEDGVEVLMATSKHSPTGGDGKTAPKPRLSYADATAKKEVDEATASIEDT